MELILMKNRIFIKENFIIIFFNRYSLYLNILKNLSNKLQIYYYNFYS